MLTDRQLAIRATGIGASEVSSLLELSPYSGPIDVWLRKPTPTRGPLVPAFENSATEVGSELEDGVRRIYERRTKRAMRPIHRTIRHPKARRVLASPDGLARDGERRGLEIKIVGARMAHHWESETVPDYVLLQCAQNMAVTGFDHWDVAALIGGTDLRIHQIDRDAELEETLIDACETFWREYIQGDRPPPITDPDERKRYLKARYPGSERTKCVTVDTDEVRQAIEAYELAKSVEKAAKIEAQEATSALVELVGDEYGIEGDWGKFINPRVAGKVDWHAVADEVAGGAVSAEIAEKFRGEPYRRPAFYGPKGAARP